MCEREGLGPEWEDWFKKKELEEAPPPKKKRKAAAKKKTPAAEEEGPLSVRDTVTYLGWVAVALSLIVAAGGYAARASLDADWAGVFYYIGVSAFVGCATNKLAIAALFDPWPARWLALPGTGLIRRKAGNIGCEVARAVGEEVLPPELFRTKSKEALESVLDKGLEDAHSQVYHIVREGIEQAGGTAGKLGEALSLIDYEKLTYEVLRRLKEEAGQLDNPRSAVRMILEEGEVAMDVEKIVRERLETLGPEGLRDIAHRLSRRHLVWLEVWGAVFGGVVGIPAWFLAG